MHFYTEAPITSFFPRITASKKRKIHTELVTAGPSNKQRRGHNAGEQERRNTPDNGNISPILHALSIDDLSTTRLAKSMWQQTSERHIPLLPSLNAEDATPQPKPNPLPSRKKHQNSLQTPPPTNEAQRSMQLAPTLTPFISGKSPDFCFERVPLPTPSTLGLSASHLNGHSGNDRCRAVQGQDLLSPTRPKRSNTSLKASVPVSISSSQSQLMADTYSEDKHHLMSPITAFPYRQLPQYEVQSSLNRITLNRRDKGNSTSHDSQIFIFSSQSQFLSPFDEHEQLGSIASNPEPDIIPSSQTQEKELRISSDPEECHQSVRSRKQALPQRTLSDELFSVSILQTAWTDCNSDPEQPFQGTADIPCVASHGDDSATESESEPETEKKDSYYGDHNPTPMQPYGLSQLSTTDSGIASLNEDSEHKDSHNSEQLSQDFSLADQISSFASLPGAVKEFKSMFGSDDESYPPDFPMSLR